MVKRRVVVRGIWYLFLVWVPVALVHWLLGPPVVPLVLALFFVPATLLSAALLWHAARRAALALLAAGVGHFLLANLLLGGPGTRWLHGAHAWVNPPGLPGALRLPGLLVGLLLPPAMAVYALRASRTLAPERP